MTTERISPLLARNGRNLRTSRGLTQQQVAAGVGAPWTKVTVSTVESGRRQLSIPELVLYARALGVGVPALLRDDQQGVPLVADLTAAQVQMILTGEVVDLPATSEGVDTMRAADLDRLAAKRLGLTVTEVRKRAKARYGRTLHRERERRVGKHVQEMREYARTRWESYERVQGTYDDLLVSSAPEKRHLPPLDTLRGDAAEARTAAEKADRQAERADSPQTRGHVTRELLEDLSDYVAATQRQQNRGKA